jgi:hypothetical protein
MQPPENERSLMNGHGKWWWRDWAGGVVFLVSSRKSRLKHLATWLEREGPTTSWCMFNVVCNFLSRFECCSSVLKGLVVTVIIGPLLLIHVLAVFAFKRCLWRKIIFLFFCFRIIFLFFFYFDILMSKINF